MPPDLASPVTAQEVTYDPRSRRVTALVVVGERQSSLRVAGSLVEMADVAVLTRAVARGETLNAADVAVERARATACRPTSRPTRPPSWARWRRRPSAPARPCAPANSPGPTSSPAARR